VDPKQAGSFRGLDVIRRHTRVSSKNAREWLMGQNAYTLHKQSNTKFPRRKTYAHGVNDLWQADLVDLSSLANQNDSNRYLLTCIDVFSKYARVEPLKNKTGSSLTGSFRPGFIRPPGSFRPPSSFRPGFIRPPGSFRPHRFEKAMAISDSEI